MTRRWKGGDAIALREVFKGKIWTARAVTVVDDTPDQLMFYVSPGMRWKCPIAPGGGWMRVPEEHWVLGDRVWEGKHALSFAWPGIPNAVLAYWDADTWSFIGWYVNLQTPLSRTPIGFDYMDHMLDVVVAPDLAWSEWKDEHELEEWVRRGAVDGDEARTIRAEGERTLRRLLAREPPFDRDWADWRPHPSWAIPELPSSWEGLD